LVTDKNTKEETMSTVKEEYIKFSRLEVALNEKCVHLMVQNEWLRKRLSELDEEWAPIDEEVGIEEVKTEEHLAVDDLVACQVIVRKGKGVGSPDGKMTFGKIAGFALEDKKAGEMLEIMPLGKWDDYKEHWN